MKVWLFGTPNLNQVFIAFQSIYKINEEKQKKCQFERPMQLKILEKSYLNELTLFLPVLIHSI